MPVEEDRALQDKIQNYLDTHKEFKSYGLNASVQDGKVILSGIVDTRSGIDRVLEAVTRLPGVRSVENDLTISTDGEITGAGVEMEVAEELEADPRVNTNHVGAEAVKGRVCLRGRVESKAEEKAALRAAAKARGVTEVISNLEFRPEELDIDNLEEIFHSQVRNDHEEGR